MTEWMTVKQDTENFCRPKYLFCSGESKKAHHIAHKKGWEEVHSGDVCKMFQLTAKRWFLCREDL